MGIEIVATVLVAGLAVVAAAMAMAGVMAAAGTLRLVRCASCRHLVSASAPACPYCRYGGLLHPLRSLHGHGTAPGAGAGL